MVRSRSWRAAAAAALLMTTMVSAQTWSSCNPLFSTDCPPDAALGMSIHVDFTQGSVNSFVASGGTPKYDSAGVEFTVANPGDAPQLTSLFYIMFGRVEFTMKSAPGAGIVSSLVLQSDDLDEIDMEWLGADGAQVQTNYFGKGQTTSYNRGEFNPAANNQGGFIKYTIDWTPDRIVWSVGGTVIRTLQYNDADGQYPQTPMQVKFGSWAGGDPSNPPGTIEWAQGPTDYSQGPFTMTVQSVSITDYSTGESYKYGDTSGTWESIIANGGAVNGNPDKGGGGPTVTASAASPTGLSPTVPAGGIGRGDTATQTGWPWVKASGTAPPNAIPSGWRMTPDGKIVPINGASGPAAGAPNLLLAASPLAVGILGAVVGCWLL